MIALAIAAVLLTTAALHVFWAVGGLWPARSEAELVRLVIGSDAVKMPPRPVTFCVAMAIALAGLWPLAFVGYISWPLPERVLDIGMWGLSAVFLLRGAATYLSKAWRSRTDMAFFSLNRRYFSPLILVIGAGFALLLLA